MLEADIFKQDIFRRALSAQQDDTEHLQGVLETIRNMWSVDNKDPGAPKKKEQS